MILPSTTKRVPAQTAARINERIRRELAGRLHYYAHHRDAIDERLRQLEAEWDTERTLQANAASLSLAGVVLGAFVNKRFLLLPGVVTGFLLQHALQGWCPPLPVLRRLGFRTQAEIARERFALKALRGDFRDNPNAPLPSVDAVLHALGM